MTEPQKKLEKLNLAIENNNSKAQFRQYKFKNPVFIKPAINSAVATFTQNLSKLKVQQQPPQPAQQPAPPQPAPQTASPKPASPQPAPQAQPKSRSATPKISGGVEAFKSQPAKLRPTTPAASRPTTPAKFRPTTPAASRPTTPAKSTPTTPAKSRPTTPAASRPTTPAASRATTPIKSGNDDDDDDDDDDKTVIADTTPRTEEMKLYETAAREILKKYNDEAYDVHLEHLDKEDFIKLKGLFYKLGLPKNIKTLGKFREYLK